MKKDLLSTDNLEQYAGFDLEKSVLACVIHDPKSIHALMEVLGPDGTMFVNKDNRAVYEAMLYLHNHDGVAVELPLLFNRLFSLDNNFDWGVKLSQISEAAPTSAFVEHYCEIIWQRAKDREAKGIAAALAKAKDSDGIQQAVDKLVELNKERVVNKLYHASEFVHESFEQLKQLGAGHVQNAIETDLQALNDTLQGGLKQEYMIVIAARPSTGKTALGLQWAWHAADSLSKPVALFSVEMGKMSLLERLYAIGEGVIIDRIRHRFLPEMELDKVERMVRRLCASQLYIDDTPNLDINTLSARALRWNEQHPGGLIVIDYLQLLNAHSVVGRNRENEVAMLSRSIKQLSRQTKCPVVVMCQLSREAENQLDHYRKLSCLRESGAIEQDADVVIIMSKATESEQKELVGAGCRESYAQDAVIICVAKHRNGPTGRHTFRFDKLRQKFYPIDDAKVTTPNVTHIENHYDEDDVF